MTNLFTLPSQLPQEELFDLLVSAQGVSIQRIISSGQTTPPGKWYNQERDE